MHFGSELADENLACQSVSLVNKGIPAYKVAANVTRDDAHGIAGSVYSLKDGEAVTSTVWSEAASAIAQDCSHS